MPIVDAATPPSSPRGYNKEIVSVTTNTTLTDNHRGRVLRVNSGSNVTLTLPRDLVAGFFCEVEQYGAGQVLFSAATGATLNGVDSFDRTRTQYSRAVIEVVAQSDANGLAAVYNLSGDITDSTGTALSATELGFLDGVTPGTAAASKAVVLDGSKGIATITSATITTMTGNVTGNVTSSGTSAFSGTVNVTGGDTNVTTSSASTDGGTSVEPVLVSTTLTGAGGVGGRMRAYMTTNVALGAWSNAFKGEVTYGAAGKTTGLGSAVLAEMTLSAGTTDGTYAPVEIELNLPTGALTGTQTDLVYMSVNGDDAATFDTNGFLFSLQGLTAATGKVLQTGNTFGTPAATLRVKVGGTTYYLPLYATEITTV